MLESIFGTSTRRVDVDGMEPIELEEGYEGPHLSFPITTDQVSRSVCHSSRRALFRVPEATGCRTRRRLSLSPNPSFAGAATITDRPIDPLIVR